MNALSTDLLRVLQNSVDLAHKLLVKPFAGDTNTVFGSVYIPF